MKLCFISEVVNPREEPGHVTKSYKVKLLRNKQFIQHTIQTIITEKNKPKNNKASEHNEKFRS